MNTKAFNAIQDLRRCIALDRHADIEPIEDYDNGFRFSARYVGDWEVPADEEDDGDYDWKVPTVATRKRLDEIVAMVNKRNPGATVSWENDGEKCWLSFYAMEAK